MTVWSLAVVWPRRCCDGDCCRAELVGHNVDAQGRAAQPHRRQHLSFWQFNRRELRDIEKCIDLAAEMGFDGVEISIGR